MSGLTDRIDGRGVWAVAAVFGAAASLAFILADGFWGALAARFLSGVGLAGVHMPGLKLLADRTAGPAQARCSAVYTASYAVGRGGRSEERRVGQEFVVTCSSSGSPHS